MRFFSFILISCCAVLFSSLYLLPDYKADSAPSDTIISTPDSTPITQEHIDWANQTLKTLTLEQKIGQFFMIAAYSNKGNAHIASVEKLIRNHDVGGLIFFQGDPLKQAYITNYYQEISALPLFIGIDAEWGLDMRIKPTIKYPYSMALGALQDNSLIHEMGSQIGLQCNALGVHINFAPVADINNNPSNPIIGFRSFGENRYKVAEKSWAYAQGLQSKGVLACAKHFPGHGDTDLDSHKELPTLLFKRNRLDSLELYPFRYMAQKGLASVMIAHLNVPVYERKPTSLSHKWVTGVLKNELGFKGLAITDALNMKGVQNFSNWSAGEVELQALLAGNHILLFPDKIEAAVNQIKNAIAQGIITNEEIDNRVREILKWKAFAGLNSYKPIDLTTLQENLFPTHADPLLKSIAAQSITLLSDDHGMLPLKSNVHIAKTFIILAKEEPVEYISKINKVYQNPEIILIKRGSNWDAYQKRLQSTSDHKQYIVSVHQPSIWSSTGSKFGVGVNEIKFIQRMNALRKSCIVFFTNPYILNNFSGLKTAVLAYQDDFWFEFMVPELLNGDRDFLGYIPVSTLDYPALHGISVLKGLRPSASQSGSTGSINTLKLQKIDPILQEIVSKKAAPGGRVLVTHRGNIVYDQSFGHHTYETSEPVKPADLYDLASVTKVAATTLAIMKLYEDRKLALDDPIAQYLPWVRGTNKANITIREILLHESGLPAWIPFYQETLGLFYDSLYASSESDAYCVEVADLFYLHEEYRFEIYQRIIHAPRGPKKYLYSDLGMILLKEVIEQASGEPFDWYLQTQFYKPLGMSNTLFNPKCCFELNRIVPTQNDLMYRRQLVHGYVHDPCAAMLGGFSGHAGLFSCAYDLAVLGQMFVQGGSFNGQRVLQKATIELFTSKQRQGSRRGLGWDRPEWGTGPSPASKKASYTTFGHTGFTGTAFWVDPKNELVYIFLSNRIYPDEENRKLISGNYRTRIQDIIYEALGT